MTGSEFVARLKSAGVTVQVDGGDLVLRGNSIPAELVELARVNKPQLLADLAEQTAVGTVRGLDPGRFCLLHLHSLSTDGECPRCAGTVRPAW